MPEPIYRHLASLDWEKPTEVKPEVRELARSGAAAGACRARLTQGDHGFFSALNEMPPRFVVPPHRHSDSELFVVLAGSCTVADGTSLSAGDVASIPAHTEYGFEVGEDGLRFVVVRAADASTRISE